jgi:hypothetical protein
MAKNVFTKLLLIMQKKEKTRPLGLSELEYQIEKARFFGQLPKKEVPVKKSRKERRAGK